jgi:hypothetical protein
MANLNGGSAGNTENVRRFGSDQGTLGYGESGNRERSLDFCLSCWLRDRRVGDMTNLAGAVIFVVGVAVKVGNHLHAQDKCGQDESESQ